MDTTPQGQRVYLHVGVPKSGTTFVQASLLQHRGALAEAGVLLPGGKERTFLAAVDVRGSHQAWGLPRSDVKGSWDTLCRRARRHEGVSVISQELLGAASARRITGAMTMLRGIEVHVVVTVRDPARQASAEWQEGIRHGRRLTFEEFRRQVLAGDSETDYARRFRAAQDLPGVLSRWASAVPEQNVHVVCCPPRATARAQLWRLFGEAVGIDTTRLPPVSQEASNPSLGTDEIDLLRRVNVALDKRIVAPEYGEVVKEVYARQLLEAGRSPSPHVPVEMYDDLAVIGERWVKEIDRVGYTVHGDLAHLMPVPPAAPVPHPDVVDPRAQVEVAASTTAELLVEMQRGRVERARLEADNNRLRRKRKKLKRKLSKASSD